MICTVGRITLHIPYARSLKEKRRVVKSVIDRTIRTFRISCIEAEHGDLWQKAGIGIAYVSGNGVLADQLEQAIRSFYEENGDFHVLDMTFEQIQW